MKSPQLFLCLTVVIFLFFIVIISSTNDSVYVNNKLEKGQISSSELKNNAGYNEDSIKLTKRNSSEESRHIYYNKERNNLSSVPLYYVGCFDIHLNLSSTEVNKANTDIKSSQTETPELCLLFCEINSLGVSFLRRDECICLNSSANRIKRVPDFRCDLRGAGERESESQGVDKGHLSTSFAGYCRNHGCFNQNGPVSPANATDTSVHKALSLLVSDHDGDCSVGCKELDRFQNQWFACGDETITRPCPDFAQGQQSWHCLRNGSFSTDEPDLSQCHSKLLVQVEQTFTTFNQIETITKREAEETLFAIKSVVMSKTTNNVSKFTPTKYLGHEIPEIIQLTKSVIIRANTSFKDCEDLTEDSMSIYANVLLNKEPWSELTPGDRSEIATNVIESMESTLFDLTLKINPRIFSGNVGNYTKNISPITTDPSGFQITVGTETKSFVANNGFSYPAKPLKSNSCIKLSKDFATYNQGDSFNYVAFELQGKYFEDLLGDNFTEDSRHSNKHLNKKVVSNLISLSVSKSQKKITGFKEKIVEVTLHHNARIKRSENLQLRRKLHPGELPKAVIGKSVCVFWDVQLLSWSTNGCRVVESKSTDYSTTCECDHLTAFALLADFYSYVGKNKSLEVLTFIVLPLSVICLVAAVYIFLTVPSIQSERTSINIHLCISLILGNLMILLFTDRHYFFMSEKMCIATGILTHYIWLCAFGWMAVEGIHLYRMIVVIFDSGRTDMKFYTLGAYGIPLAIVSATVLVGFIKDDGSPYLGEMFCWLQGAYIWWFMGPVVFVVLWNSLMTGITLKIANKMRKTRQQNAISEGSHKQWIIGFISLVSLLGTTWILGFLTLVDSPKFPLMSYLFTLLNGLQGVFIFIFHCVLNEKVRIALKVRWNASAPEFIKTLTSKSTSSDKGDSSRSTQYSTSGGTSDQRSSVESSWLRKNFLSKKSTYDVQKRASEAAVESRGSKVEEIPDSVIYTCTHNRIKHSENELGTDILLRDKC